LTIKAARIAKKSRNPGAWSRRGVVDKASDVAGKLYGESAPDIDEDWLRMREMESTSVMDSDVPKIVAVARVLDLDVNALFLSILR
jgi:hypothetical protein